MLGSIIQLHTGSITVAIVLLEVPGGILIIRSYSLGSLSFTLNTISCNSAQRYGICQFHTGSSGIIICQNSCTKKKKSRRHFSALIWAGVILCKTVEFI